MNELIPDNQRAIVCTCGSVSFALRGDGFCECVYCGKTGLYFWDRTDENRIKLLQRIMEEINGNQR